MIADPALILVDLQKDFCKPEYSHRDVSHFQPVLREIETFLRRYRETGRTPLFVRTMHDEYTTSRQRQNIRDEKYEQDEHPTVCRPGTDGIHLVPEVSRQDPEVLITKHEYSAFHNTSLDTYLSNNDISTVLVAGVNTNVCVAATVYDAYHHGYEVVVLSDCVTSHELTQHERALENIDTHFGTVRESDKCDLDSIGGAPISHD
jgi:ureidoacrylate peracid hydrolase